MNDLRNEKQKSKQFTQGKLHFYGVIYTEFGTIM